MIPLSDVPHPVGKSLVWEIITESLYCCISLMKANVSVTDEEDPETAGNVSSRQYRFLKIVIQKAP